MKFKILFVLIMYYVSVLNAAKWEEWELGGELGLGVGSAVNSGRILSPAIMVTGTRIVEDRFLELGLGYMFGSDTEINYTEKDAEYYDDDPTVKAGAEKEVTVRLSVIPMTINFHYHIYESFYIGAGIGLYHVFYSREPLGDWRVNPSSEKGEKVRSRPTTALGFQQMIGMEIFPLSEKWKWFVGIKSFITTSAGVAGSLLGLTIGGKLRYIW